MNSDNVVCLGALFIFFIAIAWILMRNEKYELSLADRNAIIASVGTNLAGSMDLSSFNANSLANLTKNKANVTIGSPIVVDPTTLSAAVKATATSRDISVTQSKGFINDIITSIVPTDYTAKTPVYSSDDVGELYKLGQEALKVKTYSDDYNKMLFKYQAVQTGVPDLYSPWRNLKAGLTKDAIGLLLGQKPTSALVPPPPPTTAPPPPPLVAIFPKKFQQGTYSCVQTGSSLVCTLK